MRIATIEDIETIQKLYLLLCQQEQAYNPTQRLAFTFSAAGTDYFKNQITSPDSFVALTDGELEPAGFLIGLPNCDRSWAKLESLFVQEAMRRLGCESHLVNAFLAWRTEKKVIILVRQI